MVLLAEVRAVLWICCLPLLIIVVWSNVRDYGERCRIDTIRCIALLHHEEVRNNGWLNFVSSPFFTERGCFVSRARISLEIEVRPKYDTPKPLPFAFVQLIPHQHPVQYQHVMTQ